MKKNRVSEVPDLTGKEFSRSALAGQTQAEARRALCVEEILNRADTVTSTDFGNVHISSSANGVRFIVGKFGEANTSTAAPVADFTVSGGGRLSTTTINEPAVFPTGGPQAADAVIMALLNAIDNR